MALPNIALYEALKKDVSEDAARMIAEVVPQTADLATTHDIERLEALIAGLEDRFKSHVDSRMLRYTAAILVPLSLTMIGTVCALIALVVQL